MNIFIDTSCLATDPFFNEIYKQEILNACKDNRLQIYISEVVIKELLHTYDKNLDKYNLDITKINTNAEKLIPNFEKFKVLDKQQQMSILEKFYEALGTLENCYILPVENTVLPVILEKAIKRSKPFSEKKTELKDALIWQTYADYINNNDLNDCYLLTANVNDFGEMQSDKSHLIHPELEKECDRIILVKDFKEIHRKYKEAEAKQPLLSWIRIEQISGDYVYNKILDKYTSNLFDHVVTHLDTIKLEKYFKYAHLIRMGGYVDLAVLDYMECSGIEFQITNDTAIVSGIFETEGTVFAFSYNSERDPGEEKYAYLEQTDINFPVHFNVVFDKYGPRDFEITSVDDGYVLYK